MVDKVSFFTKNAYVFWTDCNKSVGRLKRSLEGRQLKFDLKNQQTNSNGLIRRYPDVFTAQDTYSLVGGKYLGEGEYTNPRVHQPIIYQRPHGGEKNEQGRVINMLLQNTRTGKTAQLDPTWLVAFNIAGKTIKETVESKLTALKNLFQNQNGFNSAGCPVFGRIKNEFFTR